MKRFLPWLGLGLLTAAIGGMSISGCGSDSGGNGGGKKDGGRTTGKGGSGQGGGIIGGAGGGGNVAGTGGSGAATGGGGSGGSTPQSRLGRACATDAECGEGLKCEKANSGQWDGEGPPKGYCTTD